MVQASPSCVCWITAFSICPTCVRNVLFVVVLFIPYLRTLIWGSITSTIENHLKTTLMVSLELQLTALSDTQQLPVTYHQVRGSAADRRTHNCEVVGALVFFGSKWSKTYSTDKKVHWPGIEPGYRDIIPAL